VPFCWTSQAITAPCQSNPIPKWSWYPGVIDGDTGLGMGAARFYAVFVTPYFSLDATLEIVLI